MKNLDLFGHDSTPAPNRVAEAYADLRAQLDADQAAVVELPFGCIASVSANAGSGKTTSIVGRMLNYLAQGGDPSGVVAMTFTRFATRQIHERYQEAVGSGGNRRKQPAIGTGNGLGIRIMGRIFGLTPTVLSESEGRRLIRDLPTFQRVQPDYSRLVDAIDSLASRAETALIAWPEFDGGGRLLFVHDVEAAATGQGAGLAQQDGFADLYRRASWYSETAVQRRLGGRPPMPTRELRLATLAYHANMAGVEPRELTRIVVEFQTAKFRSNVLDYGDMLMVPTMLMLQHEHLRQRVRQQYRYFLVDEGQDLSAADFALVAICAGFPEWSKRWPSGRGLMVVGDSKQSLYWWRNGLPLVMDNFDLYLEHPAVAFRGLRNNFRSVETIVKVCNEFAHTFTRRNLFDSNAVRPDVPGPIIEIPPQFETTAREDKGLVVRMRQLNAEGIAWSDMAVLCRRNHDLDQVQAAIMAAGIPYRTRGNRRITSTVAFGFINALLRLTLDPRNILSTSALALAVYGVGEKSIPPLQHSIRELIDGDLLETVETAVRRLPGKAALGLDGLLSRVMPEMKLCLHGQPLALTLRNTEAILATQFQWAEAPAQEGRVGGRTNSAMRPSGGGAMRMTLDGVRMLHVLRMLGNVVEALAEDAEFAELSPAQQLHQVCTSLALADEPETEESKPDGVVLSTVHGIKGGESRCVFVTHLTRERPVQPDDRDGERCIFNVAVTRARDFLYLSHSAKILVEQRWRKGVANTQLLDFKAKVEFYQKLNAAGQHSQAA